MWLGIRNGGKGAVRLTRILVLIICYLAQALSMLSDVAQLTQDVMRATGKTLELWLHLGAHGGMAVIRASSDGQTSAARAVPTRRRRWVQMRDWSQCERVVPCLDNSGKSKGGAGGERV